MAMGEAVLSRPWAVDAAGSFVMLKTMSAGYGLVTGWAAFVELDNSSLDVAEAA